MRDLWSGNRSTRRTDPSTKSWITFQQKQPLIRTRVFTVIFFFFLPFPPHTSAVAAPDHLIPSHTPLRNRNTDPSTKAQTIALIQNFASPPAATRQPWLGLFFLSEAHYSCSLAAPNTAAFVFVKLFAAFPPLAFRAIWSQPRARAAKSSISNTTQTNTTALMGPDGDCNSQLCSRRFPPPVAHLPMN